jgi:hypothetical protein
VARRAESFPHAPPVSGQTKGLANPNQSESLRADSLIFDRIRCFAMLACDHLCKIIRYADMRASTIVRANRSDQYAQILFRICAESGLPSL